MRLQCLVSISALFVGGVSAANAEPSGQCPARDFQTAAGRAVDDVAASQAFSGAVLVAIDGTPVLQRAVGQANREWHVPNTVNTRFRIGSTTKTFTAVAILHLVDEGKVALDEPAAKYIPSLPQTWAGVTVRMLLSHTSGVPDYVSAPNFRERETHLIQTSESLLALVRETPLDFEPGADWRYSNTGYLLLGMVIEKASGRRYPDFLREEFFQPLGMADTGYETEDAVIERRASGYMRTRDGWAAGPFITPSSAYAAGALYSTVGDLLKWDQALYDDRLVSRAGRDLMFTAVRNEYGLGWQVRETWGETHVGHGGAIPGFQASFERYPERRLTVVALSNSELGVSEKLATDLAGLCLGVPVYPAEVALEPGTLDGFTGDYRNAEGVLVTVVRQGQRLTVYVGDQPAAILYAAGPATFFMKEADAQFSFRSEAGQTNALVVNQWGRDHVFDRVL
ncbi:serine hydrolase domain-containing protein [Brevundimonas sp.]|uniref:serine hydrolase domain-containing protein n=1 Tax=Brevundimonas sp. TaxID=1871086 RepID=UPI002D522D83|nr:serine hydrolase domain-containing protein [Brevundimonas sp.]HYD26368.1 serine hydrolase domain-containing protein [Brevundimonas sp.]